MALRFLGSGFAVFGVRVWLTLVSLPQVSCWPRATPWTTPRLPRTVSAQREFWGLLESQTHSLWDNGALRGILAPGPRGENQEGFAVPQKRVCSTKNEGFLAPKAGFLALKAKGFQPHKEKVSSPRRKGFGPKRKGFPTKKRFPAPKRMAFSPRVKGFPDPKGKVLTLKERGFLQGKSFQPL